MRLSDNVVNQCTSSSASAARNPGSDESVSTMVTTAFGSRFPFASNIPKPERPASAPAASLGTGEDAEAEKLTCSRCVTPNINGIESWACEQSVKSWPSPGDRLIDPNWALAPALARKSAAA
jgi:hypothetical protein